MTIMKQFFNRNPKGKELNQLFISMWFRQFVKLHPNDPNNTQVAVVGVWNGFAVCQLRSLFSAKIQWLLLQCAAWYGSDRQQKMYVEFMYDPDIITLQYIKQATKVHQPSFVF